MSLNSPSSIDKEEESECLRRCSRSQEFSSFGPILRAEFKAVMGQTESSKAERFVWDPWAHKGHYQHLRTPALDFFSEESFGSFMESLSQWGRAHLGCPGLSPIWMSLYLEGHSQKLHVDRPHGPWAFVYSLTLPEKLFRGGDTVIARDLLVQLWQGEGGFEFPDFFEEIPPEFGQLLVFDPKYPHGVSEVRGGVVDPLEGRLVLHGWFNEPQPAIEGAIQPEEVEEVLDEFLGEAMGRVSGLEAALGFLFFEFNIKKEGVVSDVKIMASSLVSRNSQINPLHFETELCREFKKMNFPSKKESSKLSLPLVFE